MSNHNLRLLLYAIQNDADASRLRKHGLEYAQIAVLIDQAVERGYVLIGEETLAVTPDGLEFLQRKSFLHDVEKSTMKREEKSVTTKQSVDEIYLPPLTDSYFEP